MTHTVNPCSKISYASRADARQDAAVIANNTKHYSKKTGRGPRKINRRPVPYECPRCGNWHLTTKKQRKKI